ncbi:hypothetical protein V1514DRAFT_334581 [Lipomyces japonicus]|uniref:uncharacterized protein n=1 Tax=Lipomyces japonicus TaxID=56871 RepID=UPI0034CD06E8
MPSLTDDVSNWVCFDDYPSPSTPADDFINSSIMFSNANSPAAATAASTVLSVNLAYDHASGMEFDSVQPLDLSFDWPSKIELAAADSVGNIDATTTMLDSQSSFPM